MVVSMGRDQERSASHLFYNTRDLNARNQLTGMGLELAEAERVERALAIARVLLAAASALAIYIDPTEASREYLSTYVMLGGYTLFSIGLLFFPGVSPRTVPLIQSVDVVWVSVLIVSTGGPSSAFVVFYTFAVISAAYRWGLWESIGNGVALAVVFFLLSVISLEGVLEVNRFI